MAKNVNRTARMQWKVDTIKNCIYLHAVRYSGYKQNKNVGCSQSFFQILPPKLMRLEIWLLRIYSWWCEK